MTVGVTLESRPARRATSRNRPPECLTALLLVLIIACEQKPHRTPPAQADAGARAVTVKLGLPVTEVEGDLWPRGSQRTLSLHEIKGPLELTVVLPSRRRVTLATPRALGTTDDHRWPSFNDPPEKAPPNLEKIEITVGKFAAWDQALTAVNRHLALIGVAPEFVEKWDRRLREKPVPHPSYPLEGCVYVGANLKHLGGSILVTIDIGITTASVWGVDGDWPDTCPGDSGR